jgi:tetratricopeptide (TPR) repeat protein
VIVLLRTIRLFSTGSPKAIVRLEKRGTPTILQIFCNELRIAEVYFERPVAAKEMRMNRFSSAVLIGIVLCTSGNDRSFAAVGDGDANANVASTATPEEAAIQAAAYKARLAARAAADEGYFLGRRGDFPAARKKFSQAIELDPKFSPAYRLRADACLKMSDWAGAIADLNTLIRLDPNYAEIFNERGFARRQLGDLEGAREDFDRCIALGADLPLAYGNRAEVELMLGDNSAAAADVAQARLLAATMPDSPPGSSAPSVRENQAHHKTPRTGTSNNAKGTTQ